MCARIATPATPNAVPAMSRPQAEVLLNRRQTARTAAFRVSGGQAWHVDRLVLCPRRHTSTAWVVTELRRRETCTHARSFKCILRARACVARAPGRAVSRTRSDRRCVGRGGPYRRTRRHVVDRSRLPSFGALPAVPGGSAGASPLRLACTLCLAALQPAATRAWRPDPEADTSPFDVSVRVGPAPVLMWPRTLARPSTCTCARVTPCHLPGHRCATTLLDTCD